jgi:hypothetical protein
MKGADLMADEKQLIDIEALSHFKAKQDIDNAKKFKSKGDASDLKGAVRYDTAQALTPEEKAQARANIGAAAPGEGGNGGNGGSGVSDYNELLNRPIYDDRVISNYSFKENPTPVSFTCDALNYIFYKISDLVLTKEEIFGAQITINDIKKLEFSQNNIVFETDEFIIAQESAENGWAFCFCNTVGTCNFTFSGQTLSIIVPEAGIYNVKQLDSGMSDVSIEILVSGELKQLDDKYIPNNIARLNESGFISEKNLPSIPAEKLPSYVDDVVEGYLQLGPFGDIGNFHESYTKDESGLEHWGVPIEPEKGKIYIDLIEGNTYRWSGSQYVRINPDEYTVATNADIDALFT